jgi:hypothetical protein
MKYKYYTDPGHGWLEVPVEELQRLNLIGKLSASSYVSNNRKLAYLEEDCDMGLFFKARGEEGVDMETIHSNTDSWIRKLDHWRKP